MNPVHRYIKWGFLLLFAFVAELATAQAGPYQYTGNDDVCVGQTKNYGVTKVTGSTYSWTITPGTEGVDWNLTVTDNTITVEWLKAGTYTVSVVETNADNCTGDAVEITVTVHDLPVCSITGPDNVCPGSTNAYSAPPGMSSYSWTISGDASISGAADGQSVSVIAGSTCGSYTLTLVITNEFGCSSTCSQTYNITAPPVVLTPPADMTIPSCQTQAQVDAAFASWLAGVTSSGGCTLTVTNDAGAAPSSCGGTVTVTWTAKSPCEADVVKQATFTVTPPTPVVITTPVATTVNACDYATQAELDAAFQAWLATASVSGGCKPVLTNDATGAGVLCTGGTVTVTFTATDLCESPTAQATFTVTPPTPVVITTPVATTVNACDYATQAELDAAFQAWLATASVSGGCKPVLTNDATGAGVLCTGGTVTVTFTATDLCESPTAQATFTVTPPTPVVITTPVATTVNACDYATQAELDAAFQAWLATASVSGGCKPVLTNDATGAGVLCTGGTVTVTFTATDLCESPTAQATFTVTPPTPVVITTPVATTVNACDYATQAELDAAFQAWLATASVSGGCKPVLTNDATGAGVLCTGGTVTVTFTATDLCESPTAQATFTVTPPTPVVITTPVATTVNACDYATQAELDAAFQAWLATASVSGGCKPVLTNDATGAGVLCTGGTVTVTFTATDLCESPTAQATFTVTPPTPVVITTPVATTVNACDYATQAELDAAFQAWLATASVSGGCKPVLTNDATGAGVLCTGGTVTVTFTATDLCESPTAQATFTVTPPTPVVITTPVATTVNACDYATQAELDAAFQAWLATASVSGGCKPVLTNDATGAGVLCTGGTVTVTFTATDLCESPTAQATFTVTPPTPVVITTPVATTVNACDYATQAELDAAFQAWLATASVSGGCKPVLTNDATGAGVLCTGGTVTVTFTATDLCESPTAQATFTVTPPTPVVITTPVATTVNACDYATQAELDAAFQAWLATASVSGGCKPVLTNDATGAGVLCTGGTVTVTFTATDLCESPTAQATFTVTPPTPVVITTPVATTVNACDYATQAELDAAFQAWLATASVSGGCKPVLTNDATGAGVLCTGGTVTVTFTATDLCESPTAQATFTVTPPTPVVITTPVATTVNACDYATQAELDAAFQAWLATASVSGGCKPVLTNDATGAGVLCTGGTVTVTFTATDLCESPTAQATFTVTPPTPVVITTPVATTVNACDYATQAELDAAFQAWLATASVSGGCKPVLTNDATGAGVLCTGGTVTVTFTATDLCESPTAQATFTVTPPTPVVITTPVATTVNACDYATQAELDAAFQAWLATASVSGGCKPVLTNDATGAGVLCTGGTVTVTFTATDLCESPTAQATFTVTPPTPVVITTPVATTVNACDYATQAELDAAFQAWLATASVSGGCKPVLTNDATGAGVLCTGGTVTVTFTATDLCESPTAQATFTVTPPTPVVITTPVATTVNACDYATQAELDAAFQAWLATASVSGGCKPVLTNDATGAGVLCTGGTVTVTFTATDLCESPTAQATFTVTPPTPVVITTPVATTVNACDYATQAELDAAFQAWLATASVSGGCKPVLTNDATGAGVLCTGGTVTVTFTATDLCESPTAQATFTVTPPTPVVITTPVATTVNACDYATQAELDAAFQAWLATASVSGGCKPVLTNDATGAGVLCTGGTVTVTFTATDLCESPTAQATFTVTPPTPVVITTPVATTVNACDYATQAELDAAFQAWLATASVSGGCKPVLTNDATGAGVLCTGGTVTVTFTATDLCESPTAQATFTVTPPTPVVITTPVATTVNACDYATQAELDAAFQAWLATASVSGGCKPVLTNDATGAGVLCTGGTVTVTFTATDLCESPTAQATFTVTPPTPVVITTPVATTVNACDYATQAELDAAFQAWLATASVSGGCKPVLTNDATGAGVLCTGGTVTVTFTATDLCESPTAQATFTVTPPTPVVITTPVATTVNACDYATQAELDAAFQAWLATASVSGGCKPVLTNDATGAGVLCTGGTVTVTFTATDLCESPTAQATFTVTPPTPVVITTPVATTVNACDYATQAELDAAFQAWLATASVSGGCKPVLTNDATGAGVLCTGGTVTVTFTATDLCESPTAQATFTVTPPTPVVITTPVATTVNACDYATQAELDAAFQAWLATASVSGGCKPVLTNDATGAGVLCTGGTVTVTFTATDLCESPTAQATFTVTPPTPVVITTPVATTVNACDYATQAELDAAFQAWLATASVSGGCKPVLTNDATGAGVLCTGGTVTVTFTATDLCESPTAQATFTVTPPTPVVITTPVATTVNACDYATQAELDAAFQAWLATASVSGGCKPVLTNDATGAGVLCTGGTVTVTFTATDLCESPTAQATFTVTPPTPVVITTPVATTVNACDYATQAELDAAFQAWLATASVSGGCKPVLTNDATGAGVLCTGGTVTVTFTATDLCESPTAQATFTVTPPTPVVITTPVATTVNACDYATQAELDAAFQAWLATASVSGGCKPVLTNDATGAGVLCTGGTVTVTFTATDLCESPTAQATFTVTPPTPVVITTPVATTVNACDYATQAELDAAFQAWLATASVSGGCKPVLTNDATGAGVLCTGGTVTVTFTATDLCESPTAQATFTVTPPTPVVITTPVATTVNACDYATQAELDAAFQAWLATASVSGGCKPVLTNDATGAGVLCTGGTVTVTFTATDLCESPTAQATFTVTPPTPVVITTPVATTVNACDYATQAELDAAFQAWLATASVSGGCKPVLTNDATGAGVLCTGGTVTVTFTATDLCESPTAQATFTVTPPTPVVITTPVATTVNACDYATQAELDAAFQAWLATASVSGGCKPVLTNDATGAGVLCTGGTVTVTFTATDLCESPTAQATFTVTPPTPVVITTPVATTVNACDYATQAELDAAFQAWLATASVSGGCKPVLTNDATGAGVLCTGGTVTVTFTATDLCESPTAQATFTVTPPTPVVITTPVATTVNACDYATQAELDAAFQAWLATASVSGGCKPVLTNDATGAGVLCTGGTVTVTFTATDLCESPTAQATFTVTPPTPVVITTPVATTVNACDYATQAELDAAFQAWLATASVSGGCKPVLTNDATGAGVLCTGGTVTVTFTATDLCESPTAQATFTVTPPTPVVITTPVATTVNACDYATQAELDAAFQAWLATASVSGGCKPVLTNDATGAGVLCTGGTVTVTFTATDLCESPTAQATFTVTPPTPVVITTPVATTVNACDYATQAELDAAFQAWLATASVSGGCKPVLTNDATGAGVLCTGGTVTVTFTATDLCESPTAQATFTVTPPTPVVITTPVATTVNACDYATQAELDAAFQAWLATASVSGGCKPVLTNDATGAGVLCTGGTVTVTFTATDLCESPTAQATFTVTPPTPVVITTPVATTVNACDYATQAELDAAFQAWLATASVSGGCKPVLTNDATGAGVLCTGGTVTVTFTATDLCESPTAQATFTVTPPTPVVITTPVATTVNACDYATQAELDAAFQAWLATASVSGGCKPVLTNDATGAGVLCTGGTVTVTFTATDLCESPTAQATFTVTPPTPVVITCPPPQTFCEVAEGNYIIPESVVTNSCGKDVTVTYEITGATTRTGTGTNASGAFGVGVSTITWTVTDFCGNQTTCTTTVTINPLPLPIITGPESSCVSSGTVTYSTPEVGCNTYKWTISEGGTIIGSDTGSSIVVEWTTTGTKTVTVTETACETGCSNTVSKDFVVTPKPNTTPITHD